MGKKSRRRENKEKIVELYTKKEKYNEISKLVTKLEMLGLGVFENEIPIFDMLLDIATKIVGKLLLEFKKTNEKEIKITK